MIDIARIKPAGNYVLIRRDDFDEVTRGGLHIPQVARTAAEGSRQFLRRGRGIVLAVGPGRQGRRDRKVAGEVVGFYHTGEREPLDVKVGDHVVFSILLELGNLDELGHPDCTLIREDEVTVVLEDAPHCTCDDLERASSQHADDCPFSEAP